VVGVICSVAWIEDLAETSVGKYGCGRSSARVEDADTSGIAARLSDAQDIMSGGIGGKRLRASHRMWERQTK
jgi:hypothetical protein